MIDREGEVVCRTVRTRDRREEKRVERLSVRASARKEELLYGGIDKFRCEAKGGKDRGAGGGRISTTSMRKRDEVHQACGSGFVRPPLCLSFSDLHRTQLLLLSPLAISQKNSLRKKKRRNASLRASLRTRIRTNM